MKTFFSAALLLGGAFTATHAAAACNYPIAPGKFPDGSVASREEMTSAKDLVVSRARTIGANLPEDAPGATVFGGGIAQESQQASFPKLDVPSAQSAARLKLVTGRPSAAQMASASAVQAASAAHADPSPSAW